MEKNNQIQDNIQLLMNTLQSLDIKADYDTMNKLLGCLQLLGQMKRDAANWVDLSPEAIVKAETVQGDPGETNEKEEPPMVISSTEEDPAAQ